MIIDQIIQEIADGKLEYINSHGHAKAGCNGPYNNCDTPIRNSGHWIVTYGYLWEKSGNHKYLNAVKILSEYLIDEKNYGNSESIQHRTDVRFDHVNGLIGQAWTIEALLEAANILKDDKYAKKAVKLFKVQKFDEKACQWIVVDCNGENEYDLTFNHQLWFAAAGSMILDYQFDECIDSQIRRFLSAAYEKFWNVYSDGLIVHTLQYELNDQEKAHSRKIARKRKIKHLFYHPIKVVRKKLKERNKDYSFTDGLEKGYHLFDLYGFALLKKRYKEHPIYQSEKLRTAIDYALKTNLVTELSLPCFGEPFNKFSYGYNSPAYEYPYVSMVFGQDNNEQNHKLFAIHCELLYDLEKKSFCKAGNDPETLDARIYELVRYLKMKDEKNSYAAGGNRLCI